MKYEPTLPERNDNVSPQHPIREFLTLLLGVIGLLALTFWILGFFVDLAVDSISPEEEAYLFADIDLGNAFGETETSEEQEQLQQLIDALGQCHNLPFPLTIHLIESEDINAMALPGGDIVVFSGLLHNLSSANGLTFVLGHELGHFTNRDHLRGLGRGIVMAALVTYFIGSNSDVSQMLTSTLTFGQAKYSQSRESEADKTGLEILHCYYEHVGGATELFEALQQEEGESHSSVLHYFDSHPELQKRIDAIHRLTQEKGYDVKPTKPFPDSSI